MIYSLTADDIQVASNLMKNTNPDGKSEFVFFL